MTDREQIIAAAREAGGWEVDNKMAFYPEYLERFYALAFAAGAASRDAEIAELVAQQCTSPFADSPPCRGIQRERDTIAELVAFMQEVARNTSDHTTTDVIDEYLAKVRKP